MAKQTVDVGTSASDGTGDDLRVAFTKINENFTELYSGNIEVVSANVLVYSVAGRVGNVVLTPTDIIGGVSKGYVNAAIAANIALINANVTAANAAIISLQSNVVYTMANYQHWDSNVSTIASAIDQLAARIWAIENP